MDSWSLHLADFPIPRPPYFTQSYCSTNSSFLNSRFIVENQLSRIPPRIPPAAMHHKTLATAVCNDTRFLLFPRWTLFGPRDPLQRRSHHDNSSVWNLVLLNTKLQNEFTPSTTLMGPFFFFPTPERIHGSENHCHFIALCFTSKCGFLKYLKKKGGMMGPLNNSNMTIFQLNTRK